MSNLARKLESQQVVRKKVQPKQKPALRRVRSTITRGEKAIVGFLLVAGVGLSSFILANYASIYTVNQEIHTLERSIQQQAQVNDGLQLQVVELSAPDRILHIATEKLGMTLDDNKVKVIQN
ncbi:cell division protein FtsL [Bacillus sp. FJAT-45350]|uniref:cell division protein FtsL n=1 Tax=Bacillus sp. FJAT-45350 TaxID=2011014 RepID=UPI000BB8975B|nr:cell division protein FtsL [Bacillus sp. FJAT-45350]